MDSQTTRQVVKKTLDMDTSDIVKVRRQGQGSYGPRTRTCKFVLADPRTQGLSSRTITLCYCEECNVSNILT